MTGYAAAAVAFRQAAAQRLCCRAWATRTTRRLAFVQAVLSAGGPAFATAQAVAKPA